MTSRSVASENRFPGKEKKGSSLGSGRGSAGGSENDFQNGSENDAGVKERARLANRDAFPGVAAIVDAFRDAGAGDGLPPFNPKVLWASENGREIGKRVPFESDDAAELIARLDRKP